MIIADFHWLLGNKQKARDCSSIKWGALWGSTALLAVINWLFITLQEIKQWPRKGCTFNLNSWREREREREEGVLRTNKVTPHFRWWRVRCRGKKEGKKKNGLCPTICLCTLLFPSHLHPLPPVLTRFCLIWTNDSDEPNEMLRPHCGGHHSLLPFRASRRGEETALGW